MSKNRICLCVCLMVLASGLTGCARQATFRPGALPAQFAAKPTIDFSTVDLTRLASQPVDGDRIRAGDRLQVRLNSGAWENAENLWKVGVDSTGQASLPGVGAVRLAGLTKTEAEQSIVQTSVQRDVYLTPVVDVTLEGRLERTITVTGAVNEPGTIKIPDRQVTLADAIVRAGGLTSESSGQVTISGTNPPESSVAATDNALIPIGHSSSGTPAQTISLQNTSESELAEIVVSEGGIVSVEKQAPRPLQVIGVIPNKAIEIPPGKNVRLLDALTMAGGPTYSSWILDKVHVIRRVPGRPDTVCIRGSIRRAKADPAENFLLAPYDIVSVEENAMTFTLSTLSGLFGVGVSAARIGVTGGM